MSKAALENKVLGYDFTSRKAAFGDGSTDFNSLPRAFGIEPAPDDGHLYARKMGEWVRIVIRQQEEV